MSLCVSPLAGAELTIEVGSQRTLTTEELLARPDATTIEVPGDATYQRTMRYRAVPLRGLLGVDRMPADQDLQVIATDGFVTNLPAGLVFPGSSEGSVPWLAIEPPDRPWPPTSGGLDIGPFYLVWVDAAASGVLREQWPYQVSALRAVPAHADRWPQLAVSEEVPADSPVRAGEKLFATQCMVCHLMNGAGDAKVGPDLNLPRNPTEYFQPWALRAYIRDPASIRDWPDMRMPGFGEDAMSDADLDAIIAYLGHMVSRRQ
jgi:mono/diheme cytochrome c family protein